MGIVENLINLPKENPPLDRALRPGVYVGELAVPAGHCTIGKPGDP